jgi:hypothetical protein
MESYSAPPNSPGAARPEEGAAGKKIALACPEERYIVSIMIRYRTPSLHLVQRMAGRAFFVALLVFAGALFIVAPAYAAPGDTFPLDRFTDVPALMSAVSSARAVTQALLTQNPSRNDRAHLEKALVSLDAAIAGGFTASKLEKFLNDVRQANDALENVTAGKPIAGDLAEAVRAATAKFLENVERAIPRLSDTKTREDAAKDLEKAKDDYARGVAAISAGRRGEAINHFRQAIRRMVGYPLERSEDTSTEILYQVDPQNSPVVFASLSENGDLEFVQTTNDIRFLSNSTVISGDFGRLVASGAGDFASSKRGVGYEVVVWNKYGQSQLETSTLLPGIKIAMNGSRILMGDFVEDEPGGLLTVNLDNEAILQNSLDFNSNDASLSADGAYVGLSSGGTIFLLNTSTGESKPIAQASGTKNQVVLAGKTYVIVCKTFPGVVPRVVAYDYQGNSIWNTSLEGAGRARVASDLPGDRIVVASETSLWVFRTENGAEIWSNSISSGYLAGDPAISDSATLIVVATMLPSAVIVFSDTGSKLMVIPLEASDLTFGTLRGPKIQVARDGTWIGIITPRQVLKVTIR